MPSDPRVTLALAALAPRLATFRAALAAAREQVCAHLATHGSGPRDRVIEAAAELGPFAGGRIDVARFAAIAAPTSRLDASTEQVVLRCADILDDLLEHGDALFTPIVHAGGDLRATVSAALAEAGRAFGAVLAFQAVRSGSFEPARHEPGLIAFPFARWNRAEREIGPPLVVRVSGADLSADGLAEFLDGRQQLVLVVDGPCAPAPLARLVSPGVLVMQTEGDLAPLASFRGPSIAAIVPEGAALFTSDGATVTLHRAAAEPKSAIGGWSRAQQQSQLAHLATLSVARVQPVLDGGKAIERIRQDPTDRSDGSVSSVRSPFPHPASVQAEDDKLVGNIADWLLGQAGFPPQGAAQ
jgi:hypothetical protein